MKLVRATTSGVIPAFGITVTEGDQFWVPDDAYGAFEEVRTRRQTPGEDDVVAETVLDHPEDGDPHSATSEPVEPTPVDETTAAEPEAAPAEPAAPSTPTQSKE